MHLDGFDTQMQALGDLPGSLPLTDQLKHLELTVAEPFDGRQGHTADAQDPVGIPRRQGRPR